MRIRLFIVILVIGLKGVLAQTSHESLQTELENNINKLLSLMPDNKKINNTIDKNGWIAYIKQTCQIEQQINIRGFDECMIAELTHRNQLLTKAHQVKRSSLDNFQLEQTLEMASQFNYQLLTSSRDEGTQCAKKMFLRVIGKEGTIIQNISLEQSWGDYAQKSTTPFFKTQKDGLLTNTPITLMDMNFDGFDDLVILTGLDPQTQKPQYDIYIFDPESYQFAPNKMLSDILHNGGDYRIDSQNQQILNRYIGGDNQTYEATFIMVDQRLPSLKDLKKND